MKIRYLLAFIGLAISFAFPSNLVGRVNRVIAVGNDVRAYGTWSETWRDTNGGPINGEGYFLWVNVREGNTWKIRKSSSSVSNSHN